MLKAVLQPGIMEGLRDCDEGLGTRGYVGCWGYLGFRV